MRESPALRIIELLHADGADVRYHDPHVAELHEFGLSSVPLSDDELISADCAVVVTDHSVIDYAHVAATAPLTVDLRNVVAPSDTVVRL